jgi:hypothetical protein
VRERVPDVPLVERAKFGRAGRMLQHRRESLRMRTVRAIAGARG